MEKQIFLSGWKRPEGVNIYTVSDQNDEDLLTATFISP